MKSTPYVAVATSTSPVGPFTLRARWLPNGEPMGDSTAFLDRISGRGWWIYSRKATPAALGTLGTPGGPDEGSGRITHPRVLRLSQMTPDLLNLTGVNATIPKPLEAPAVFYHPTVRRYYVWASHCSGWRPNAASVHSALSLDAPAEQWRDEGNPTRNATSFASQSTYILLVGGAGGTSGGVGRLIYVADRWDLDAARSGGDSVSQRGGGGGGGTSSIESSHSGRYIWLPIEVRANGSLSVQWRDPWKL